jgi:hypothetical protein
MSGAFEPAKRYYLRKCNYLKLRALDDLEDLIKPKTV